MKNLRWKTLLFVALCLAVGAVACESGENEQNKEPEQQEYKGTLVWNVEVPTNNLPAGDNKISLYLPSDWQTSGNRYPVLYLLHGMWDNNNAWIDKGTMHRIVNAAIQSGDCSELIVVMPYCSDDFYVNGYSAGVNYEDYFHEDLIPFVEANYPCRTDRLSRAIAGLSMGGYGTVFHAFSYPEKFCVAYSMSGAVEGMGNARTPSLRQIFEQRGYATAEDFALLPELTLECGVQDNLCYTASVNTHAYLEEIGFPHTYITRDGVHDWVFWKACLPKALKAASKHFKTE